MKNTILHYILYDLYNILQTIAGMTINVASHCSYVHTVLYVRCIIKEPDVNTNINFLLLESGFANCAGPVYVQPEALLIGSAATVVPAANLAECVDICVNAVTVFNFECYSGNGAV